MWVTFRWLVTLSQGSQEVSTFWSLGSRHYKHGWCRIHNIPGPFNNSPWHFPSLAVFFAAGAKDEKSTACASNNNREIVWRTYLSVPQIQIVVVIRISIFISNETLKHGHVGRVKKPLLKELNGTSTWTEECDNLEVRNIKHMTGNSVFVTYDAQQRNIRWFRSWLLYYYKDSCDLSGLFPQKVSAPWTWTGQPVAQASFPSRVCRCFLQLYFIVSLFKGYRKKLISMSCE